MTGEPPKSRFMIKFAKASNVSFLLMAGWFITISFSALCGNLFGNRCLSATDFRRDDLSGWWTGKLESPGGDLSFEILLDSRKQKLAGWIVNGSEKVIIDDIQIDQSNIKIRFPHYDSWIEAKLEKEKLLGQWKKETGKPEPSVMKFTAIRGRRKFSIDNAKTIVGRYEVKFESSDDLAVLDLKKEDRFLGGTFLTTTGDYRYLAGNFDSASQTLELSCFDGGHAFLFRAKRNRDNTLKGDFWSRNSWHEEWIARKNSKAKIADGFQQVQWAGIATSKLEFPDEDGKLWNLADKKFSGKVKIIQVFGSWCPNCHDAAVFLNELRKEYGSKGLSVVGLAFELTKSPERNSTQIKRYRQRTGASYPILIAGLADKSKATEQLQILSRVKSYPTTIFLDDKDRPIAIHSGFSGPATGDEYDSLKRKFRKIIDRQLMQQ